MPVVEEGAEGQDVEESPIQRFYRDSVVLITGGTGFMGKVLTEKLLRSCPGVSQILLIVRPKKGKGVHQRVDEIFDDPVSRKCSVERLRVEWGWKGWMVCLDQDYMVFSDKKPDNSLFRMSINYNGTVLNICDSFGIIHVK